MLTPTFYCKFVNGKIDKDYGQEKGLIVYNNYNSYIVKVLMAQFCEYYGGSKSPGIINRQKCVRKDLRRSLRRIRVIRDFGM